MIGPEPVDDFLRQDREQAEADKKRPHCDECGEPIWDYFAYDIGGRLLCEECINNARVYLDD